MRMRPVLLCSSLLVVLSHTATADQLQNLLNFVKGGSNPAPSAGRSKGPAVAAPSRHAAAVSAAAAPIPFAELADPSRGTVELDVPQPRQAKVAAAAAGGEQLRRMEEAAQSRFKIAGLPAGSTQVGGKTVGLKPVQRKRPAPLSEVEAPVFLKQGFPNPLNDINPNLAPLQEPFEATLQPPAVGRRPAPVAVPNNRFAEIEVLNQLGNNRVRTSARTVDRISNSVFQGSEDAEFRRQEQIRQLRQQAGQLNPQLQEQRQQQQQRFQQQPQQRFQSQQQQQQPRFQPRQQQQQQQPRLQPQQQQQRFQQQPRFQPRQQQQQEQGNEDVQPSHQEQLRQHQLAVDAVIEQQQQQQQEQPQQQQPVQQQHRFQPQRQQQHRFQPQQPANEQVRQGSHFSIPGQHRHRQFADELKLAQEALKTLG